MAKIRSVELKTAALEKVLKSYPNKWPKSRLLLEELLLDLDNHKIKQSNG